MFDMLVIVPTRGRPAAALDLARTFERTCTDATQLMFAVDEDDPSRDAYLETLRPFVRSIDVAVFTVPGPSTMVKALNAAATHLAGGYDVIAFMGDDHRPRTIGWDKRYMDALTDMGVGMVYGDDLLQHERIPTQIAMTSNIIRALGHMAPPNLTHLFVDNYWRDLGAQAGCLRYLPDVVVEHLHPMANKAVWDEGHMRVNAPEMYQKDQAAYQTYVYSGLVGADVVKVKAL